MAQRPESTESRRDCHGQLPLPYHSLDAEGRIRTVNQPWLDVLGYDRSAVEGEPFEQFLTSESTAAFEGAFDAVADGERVQTTLTVRHADGQLLTMDYAARGTVENGSFSHTHAQLRDVTERREREIQLAKSQDVADIGRWSKDIPSDRIWWSEEVYEMWGVEKGSGAIDHETFRAHVHPEDRDAVEAAWEAALAGDPYDVEHRILTDDGAVRWVREKAEIEFERGEPVAATGIVQNITERKQREQQLAQERAKYRTLIEESHDGIVVVQGTDIVVANEQLAALLGEPDPAAVEGTPFVEFIAPSHRELVRDRHRARMAGASVPGRYEAALQSADGKRIPVELNASKITYEGEPADMAVVRDIRERKAREQKLRRFKRAAEAAGQAIYITSPDGTIEYVNQAFERVTGYAKADAVGENPRLLKSGEMSPAFYRELWDTVLSGEVWEAEFVNRRKDGETYAAHQTISPITDENGDIEAFVAIQADITDRIEREETITERTERLDLALEGAELGVWDWDMQADTVHRDDRWAAQLGYDTGEIDAEFHGRESLIHPDDRATHDEALQAHVAGEADYYRCEYRLRTSSGTWKWIRNVGKIVERAADGTPLRAVGVHQDIDDQKRTRKRLERNNELLQAIDRVLRHNLHNDMNVVEGYADTIRERATGRLEAQAETIVETSQALLDTVDKERRITSLLAEPDDPEVVDLGSVLPAAVDRLRAQYPEATITQDLPLAAPVVANPNVDQALAELLENAVVHSNKASPHVRLAAETDGESVVVTVADDGPGIPEMERAVLTDATEITPLYHGDGLGLWFVNLVVDQSDGDLTFAENEPHGSVVTVRLPRS